MTQIRRIFADVLIKSVLISLNPCHLCAIIDVVQVTDCHIKFHLKPTRVSRGAQPDEVITPNRSCWQKAISMFLMLVILLVITFHSQEQVF